VPWRWDKRAGKLEARDSHLSYERKLLKRLQERAGLRRNRKNEQRGAFSSYG
jgi:hypothetical protein